MAVSASGVRVRPLNELDIEAITRIDEKVTGLYRPDFWESRVAYYLRRDPEASRVAEVDGEVVGFMLGDVRGGEFGLEETSGWIERFGVDPSQRGKGLGRQLFEELAEYFRAAGAERLRTLVDSRQAETESFLRALGFENSSLTALEQPLGEGKDGSGEEVMKVETHELPKKYRDAIDHWCRHNFPDLPLLNKYWSKYFPNDDEFCLCAKMDLSTSKTIEVGDRAGEAKSETPADLGTEPAKHLLPIIRAQASTEFGSIQQHQVTIDRAPNDQDRFWVLRVMAEELRHGYQMFHLLTSRDWSSVTDVKPEDMVENVLAMKTGSHVLEAFNLAYDSFVDNVVFAAVIDRVGKYQLTMQKVCAYRPFAQSMPPMLREEAFHLAAGVVPMRRWMESAAKGDPFVTVRGLQHSWNKWLPRGLEMFGDERGGDTNVRLGFKDKKNREAQMLYYRELERLIRDLNLRYLRARHPAKSQEAIEEILRRVMADPGSRVDGVGWDDVLHLAHPDFFRRRGEPAYRMVGMDGREFTSVPDYLTHLAENLSEAYTASRDMRVYADTMFEVAAGTLTREDAAKKAPKLERSSSVCPCSKSVRWVEVDEKPANGNGNGHKSH